LLRCVPQPLASKAREVGRLIREARVRLLSSSRRKPVLIVIVNRFLCDRGSSLDRLAGVFAGEEFVAA